MKRDIIDVLDECVEEIINNKATLEECLDVHKEERSALEPLLVSTLRLREAAKIAPDQQRKRAARERLLAAVEQKAWETGVERQSIPRTTRRSRNKSALSRPFAKFGIVTLVFAMLSSGTLVMAKESMPGNPLYPVKLAVEKARIGVAGSDEKKAALYLDFAAKRVDELKALNRQNKDNPALMEAVAKNIEAAQTASEDSAEFKSSMDDLARKNSAVLETVMEKVPDKAKPAIERALSNIKDESAAKAGKRDLKGKQDKKGSNNGETIDKESNRDDGLKINDSEQREPKEPQGSRGGSSNEGDGERGKVQGGGKESSLKPSKSTTRTTVLKKSAPAAREPGGSGTNTNDEGDASEDLRDDAKTERKIWDSKNQRKDSCSSCKSMPPVKKDGRD